MFIYSIRASTVKVIAVILLCILGLGVLLGVAGDEAVYASADGTEINYGGVRSAEERIKFLEQFGLAVNPEPTKEETVALPESFDRVLGEYNELQKLQGLDLTKYRGKRVTHYMYEVTNYNHTGKVYANVYVCRGRVIGCDLSSTEGESFVIPLTDIDSEKLADTGKTENASPDGKSE